MSEHELYHYGVKGMKWGRRKDDYSKRVARGHAGPGKYATKKRQLAGDKKDIEGQEKGQHLSIGFGKKRQAAFDARDKAALEKRISKNNRQSTVEELRRTQKAKEVAAFILGSAVGAMSFRYIVQNTDLVGITGATTVATILGSYFGGKTAASFFEDNSTDRK